MDKKDIALIVAFKAKLDAEYADSLLNKNPFVPIFCQTRRTRELFYYIPANRGNKAPPPHSNPHTGTSSICTIYSRGMCEYLVTG